MNCLGKYILSFFSFCMSKQLQLQQFPDRTSKKLMTKSKKPVLADSTSLRHLFTKQIFPAAECLNSSKTNVLVAHRSLQQTHIFIVILTHNGPIKYRIRWWSTRFSSAMSTIHGGNCESAWTSYRTHDMHQIGYQVKFVAWQPMLYTISCYTVCIAIKTDS